MHKKFGDCQIPKQTQLRCIETDDKPELSFLKT